MIKYSNSVPGVFLGDLEADNILVGVGPVSLGSVGVGLHTSGLSSASLFLVGRLKRLVGWAWRLQKNLYAVIHKKLNVV